jgi:hypothetical protein
MIIRSELYFGAMKKLLFLGACLVALASQPTMAQTGGADVVVMQAHFGASAGYIIISRGPGKTEKQEFKTKNEGAEAEAYQQVIAKLYQEGYTIKSAVSPGISSTSTLVFTK